MNEDDLSRAMYLAARSDSDVEVVSWQGVGGKSYFTRDVQLRLPNGVRKSVDLILRSRRSLWLIEAKGTHRESKAEDEPKLAELRSMLTDTEILGQVAIRTGKMYDIASVRFAVAYSLGSSEEGCVPWIVHIAWESVAPEFDARGFGEVLSGL